jgi:hypothetical protein
LVGHACTVASDPLKLAQFREVLRLRRACVAARDCSSSDAAFRNFNRLLTKVGEHTWGVDVKVAVFPHTTVFSPSCLRDPYETCMLTHLLQTFLNDTTHWSNAEFEAVKEHANFGILVNSWIEQRSFITNALRALSSSGACAFVLLLLLLLLSDSLGIHAFARNVLNGGSRRDG